jgi:hypothetical protein
MDEWRRKPILFVFGPDFRETFRKAHAGAARARIAARPVPPDHIRRPIAPAGRLSFYLAQMHTACASLVMGDLTRASFLTLQAGPA